MIPKLPRRAWLPLLGLLVVLAASQLPRLVQMTPAGAAIGGPFTLTDQQGRIVHDSDFRGKLMLVYFGYSFCPDICPTTLTQVGQVYRDLTPDQQNQVAPIFITIDPERDTVAQLALYVPAFLPALTGLTGSPEQIAAVTRAYHVYSRKAGSGENYSVDHSSILYLMGKDGRFLRHFDAKATNGEILAALQQALTS